MYIDNKRKSILILGKSVTQELNHTLAAETQYSSNFTRPGITFCLNLHYNRSNSFWNKEILLVFRKYFRRFSSNNMKKAGLNGYVYDFSVDYRAFDASNIIDIK